MWASFRARRAWVALTLFSALRATAGVQASDQPVDKKPGQLSLEQQRETYIEAQRALSQRQMKRYRALAAELQDYPLLPYLQYQEMTRQLSNLSSEEVANFLYEHPYSYLGEQRGQRWLRHLAAHKRWDEYRQFYHSDLNDTRLHCHQLFARLENRSEERRVGKERRSRCAPAH